MLENSTYSENKPESFETISKLTVALFDNFRKISKISDIKFRKILRKPLKLPEIPKIPKVSESSKSSGWGCLHLLKSLHTYCINYKT